jgi:hypothetical protein
VSYCVLLTKIKVLSKNSTRCFWVQALKAALFSEFAGFWIQSYAQLFYAAKDAKVFVAS